MKKFFRKLRRQFKKKKRGDEKTSADQSRPSSSTTKDPKSEIQAQAVDDDSDDSSDSERTEVKPDQKSPTNSSGSPSKESRQSSNSARDNSGPSSGQSRKSEPESYVPAMMNIVGGGHDAPLPNDEEPSGTQSKESETKKEEETNDGIDQEERTGDSDDRGRSRDEGTNEDHKETRHKDLESSERSQDTAETREPVAKDSQDRPKDLENNGNPKDSDNNQKETKSEDFEDQGIPQDYESPDIFYNSEFLDLESKDGKSEIGDVTPFPEQTEEETGSKKQNEEDNLLDKMADLKRFFLEKTRFPKPEEKSGLKRKNSILNMQAYNVAETYNLKDPNSKVQKKEKDDEVSYDDYQTEERGKWRRNAEFILSCIGVSVGLGNIWRFPYQAYNNEGGSFLIPYVVLIGIVGFPMYFMECALGQYCSRGPFEAFNCFPVGKGVAIAMIISSLLLATYFNVIMTYTLYYMVQSVSHRLPWEDCYETWGANNATCYSINSRSLPRCSNVRKALMKKYRDSLRGNASAYEILVNEHGLRLYIPKSVYHSAMSNCTNATVSAAEMFWKTHVLGNLTDGVHNLGRVKWDLVLALFLSWLIIFFCLIRGGRTTAKMLYFTATTPFLILLMMLFNGLTTEGSGRGVWNFFVPTWRSLFTITVWLDATEQLFFSLSISWGGLIMFGSYNKFNYAIYRDTFVATLIDLLTSIVAGVIVFSTLGQMSLESDTSFYEVVGRGQGLSFVVFPEALSRLAIPKVWSVLFFLLLFLLGVDFQYYFVDTFLQTIQENFPKTRPYKAYMAAGLCTSLLLFGVPMVTQGGQYIVFLMDRLTSGFSLICIAFCELIFITWGYGVSRICDDFEFMLGRRPGWYLQMCWSVLTPLVLLIIFFFSINETDPLIYPPNYVYPLWTDVVAYTINGMTLIQIPLWAAKTLYENKHNLRNAFKPSPAWGPRDYDARKKIALTRQKKLIVQII